MKKLLLGIFLALLPAMAHAQLSGADLYNPSSGGGSSITWPTSGDVVISNSSSSPAGVAPVNGDCLLGSGGAWTAGSCSGSSAIGLANTTSNVTYYLGFTTTTSGTTATIYGTASALTFNASTGNLTATALTTTGLTVNGNASLSGTTTLGTAQIGAGNALLTTLTATNVEATNALATTITATNGFIANVLSTTITGTTGNFPTLNFTNALGTTITATNAELTNALVSTLTGTTANISNMALSGTATIATAQIGAGNAIFTTVTGTNGELTNVLSTTITGTTGNFPTLNFTNALGSTITSSSINLGGALFITTTGSRPSNGIYSNLSNWVTIATNSQDALSMDNNGNTSIRGNLTVNGTTTTVNNLSINGTCTGCTSTPAAGSLYNIQYNNGSNGFAAATGLNVSTTTGGLTFLAGVTTANLLSLGSNGADVTSYYLGESAGLAQSTTNRQSNGIGAFSLTAMTTGTNNNAFGDSAGQTITTGQNNTVLGDHVGSTTLTVGSDNILIGVNSAIDTTTTATSNTINIGGSGGSWVNVSGTNTNATEVATMNGALNTSVTSATAFTVGQSGTTNPVLTVDTSVAAAVAGLSIKGNVSGGIVTITGTDSASNNSLTIANKGNGNINLGGATGTISMLAGNGTQFAITNGKITLEPSNTSVTTVPKIAFVEPALTSQTASTNDIFMQMPTAVITHATGSQSLQTDVQFNGLTDAYNGSSTLTNGATFEIALKGCGTNATCTNESGLYIPSLALLTTGTITNSYGINVAAATGATNNFAGLFNGQTEFNGHVNYLGSAPTVSACGTSPSIDANATDTSGTVTVGTVAAASCTVTFATAYSSFAHCRVTPQTPLATFAYTYTTSAIVVTATSLLNEVFDYSCDGR